MTQKIVKVYSVPTCPWCRKAKQYLEESGIAFTDINVAEDKAKLKEMVELSGQRGVPVVVVDGEVMVGFSKEKLDKALSA